MKKLNELFDCEYEDKIYSIHSDSRYVRRNSMFFCIEGLTVDGHQYISDALFQGAIAIVHSKKLSYYRPGIRYFKVDDVKAELNRVANIFFDYPSSKMKTIGVTGSGGKTILSTLINNALKTKYNTGYIGSQMVEYDGMSFRPPVRTPEVVYLHQHLSRMVSRGVDIATLEISSAGLSLHRFTDIQFDIVALTSISPRHLELHGTFEEYLEAKLSLFSQVDENSFAILNQDDDHFEEFKNATKAKVISYSLTDKSDIYARNLNLSLKRNKFDLIVDDQAIAIDTKLSGKYNLYHVLALAAVLKACQIEAVDMGDIINSLDIVPGRYEVLETAEKFDVIIDYCQELDDYEKIFTFAKRYVKDSGRIIGVFGTSSYRGHGFRDKLGRIANRYLDHVILTNQDDRLEVSDIEEICGDVQANLKKPSSIVISQRQIAIQQAIEISSPNDIILILGKGDDKYMGLSVGTNFYPGDRAIVMEAIENVYHRPYQVEEDDYYCE